jgi:hypothetical protein
LADSAAGGDYEFAAHFVHWNGAAAAPRGVRRAEVRAYRPPRLKTDLDFMKQAYGPGDKVIASLRVTRAEGGAPAGATVTAVAVLDGTELHRSSIVVDRTGFCEVRFTLPADIPGPGEGSLSMAITDGGVQESAVKTIPIPRASGLTVHFYPEGGDLAPRVTQRVYVEARTAKGRPADVAGSVIETATGRVVAAFRTTHEGRGRFELANDDSCLYHAQLHEPSGIVEKYSVGSRFSGACALRVLSTSDDVVARDMPLRVEVGPGAAAWLAVAIKGQELVRRAVDQSASKTSVSVSLTDAVAGNAYGILRVTLYDASTGSPLCERLVFRHAPSFINVAVSGPKHCGLRDKVAFTITTTDAAGAPVDASVCVVAVDDAAMKKIEKRDRAPRLMAQALLESDVQELRDATSYFPSSEEEGSAEKMDLLLGTQGWRRFLFEPQHLNPPRIPVGDAARLHEIVLAQFTPPPPRPPPVPTPPMMACVPMAAMRNRAHEIPCAMAMPPPSPPAMEDIPQPCAAADQLHAPELAVQALQLDECLIFEAPEEMQMHEDECDEYQAAPVFERCMEEPEIGFVNKRDRAIRPVPQPPVPQGFHREYAHACAGPFAGNRSDFAEVLLWMPHVRTTNGSATVEFDLCDSVTSFEVRADAITVVGGMLGEGSFMIEARRPFYIEPKLPLEMAEGDTAIVPIACCNGTGSCLDVVLSASGAPPIVCVSPPPPVSVQPNTSARSLATFTVSASSAGSSVVAITGSAGAFSDSVRRSVAVAARGFPIELSFGGNLPSSDACASHTIAIPQSARSLVISAKLYTSPAASLESACESMLQEPCGCFEQTSSSAYPNVMILRYLLSHSGVNPELVKRAQALLDAGLKRLTTFECKEKGYEWFGGDPGHEALTAYGLMEFTEMSTVTNNVDPSMLVRTRAWLMSRRDGKGGFLRNPQALDSFGGAPADTTDAYITWALSQSDVTGIDAEVDKAAKVGLQGDDTYVAALAANILLNRGDATRAQPILEKLAAAFAASGGHAPDSSVPSITGSTGSNLVMETTSLAVLAFIRAPPRFAPQLEAAFEWLMSQCKNGRFGATQATILALKGIVAVDEARPQAHLQPGEVTLSFGGASAAVALDTSKTTALDISSCAVLGSAQDIVLHMTGGFAVPYSISVSYVTDQPADSCGCLVSLSQQLSRNSVREGETVDLNVLVKNRGSAGVAMTVAIIGIPGGLEARADQLRELVKESKLDCYELRSREVILYWRGMAAGAEKPLSLSLLAAVPGQYTGPASRAYLYYADDAKEALIPPPPSLPPTYSHIFALSLPHNTAPPPSPPLSGALLLQSPSTAREKLEPPPSSPPPLLSERQSLLSPPPIPCSYSSTHAVQPPSAATISSLLCANSVVNFEFLLPHCLEHPQSTGSLRGGSILQPPPWPPTLLGRHRSSCATQTARGFRG